jgi:hypothetical protein
MRFRSTLLVFLALVVATSGLYLVWRPRPRAPVSDREKDVVLLPEPSPTPSPSPIAAPTLPEVQPTLDRVFDQTLILEAASQPAFLAADFNGDSITDLAAVVRPVTDALPKLNDALANWSLQDAARPPVIDAANKPEPVSVAAGDRLLAVVHGVDAAGWRSPEARQGYLVKNAVGSQMRLSPLTKLPDAIRMATSRAHVGDVILEERGGERGVILWTGAAYAWAGLRAVR